MGRGGGMWGGGLGKVMVSEGSRLGAASLYFKFFVYIFCLCMGTEVMMYVWMFSTQLL